MMKRLIACTLVWGVVSAEVTSNVIVDWYLSPYVGADDLLSAHRGLELLEERYNRKPESKKNSFWKVMGRFSDLFFVWDPINITAVTVQHEVFGHGFRGRSVKGAQVKGYKIGVPFPYGPGGGWTSYKLDLKRVTAFEELTIASGGVEGSAILANRLKMQWLQRGKIDPRESSLYTNAEQDVSQYIWLTSRRDKEEDGDVSFYTHFINRIYPKGHLTVQRLKQLALVNLIDPFTFYSVYAWWYYIFTGKQGPMPLIRIKEYRYICNARLGLTSYGPEYYFENFLVKDQKPIYFYLRGGRYADQNYYGFGMEHAYLWEIQGVPFGFRVDGWLQPHYAFETRRYSMEKLEQEGHFSHQPHNPHVGIALSVIGHKKMSKHTSFYFQVGGKTKGYLEGEPLSPSVIARVGMSFR